MHRIILAGIKHSGKSTIGWHLSSRMGLYFADLDDLILRDNPQYSTIRELYRDLGAQGFKEKEVKSLDHFLHANKNKSFVLSLGGGTIENTEAIDLLQDSTTSYFLDAECDDLFRRISRGGIPPFLEGENPYQNFKDMYEKRTNLYKTWADREVDTRGLQPLEVSSAIESMIDSE